MSQRNHRDAQRYDDWQASPWLARAITRGVADALAEDVRDGDVTAALVPAEECARARIITREAGVFCGRAWVAETCRQVDPGLVVSFEVDDGDAVEPDQVLFYLTGNASSMLTAERTFLNFVQLLSGTATRARDYASRIAHTHARVLDTRKTIPGLRLAQKYAVACGGGSNHRVGLFDAFLIKENHIAAAGSIRAAVETAARHAPDKPIEVEVESLDELRQAMDAGAHRVMLDDFDLTATREGVELAAGRVEIEASGGIDFETIVPIAETGVDYISIGDITKRVTPLDLSMRIIETLDD
ncbi:MAG: carboxylating nicotinate-nucleotide diphosphorylase [Pseudomonadota bacterium]